MSDPIPTFAMLAALAPFHFVLQLLGALGSLIYVGGYLLVQCGHICGNSVAFTASKLVAAGMVLLSLGTAFNLAAFLIQVSFIAISIYGLWYRLSGRLAARCARIALHESTRAAGLADDAARAPDLASAIYPVAFEEGPGRPGRREDTRRPGQRSDFHAH